MRENLLSLPGGLGVGTLVFFCLWTQMWTRTYTICSSGSRAFGLGLKLQDWLSWVSSLLASDPGTSQPPRLREPRPYCTLYTHPIDSVPLENPDQYRITFLSTVCSTISTYEGTQKRFERDFAMISHESKEDKVPSC